MRRTGINIIDAIKSGKPIQHPLWGQGWVDGKYLLDCWSRGDARPMTTEMLLSDSWECQEPTVTITRNQFWTSVNACSTSGLGEMIFLDYLGIEALARRLDLEPGEPK